jgi:hypothetical protein
MADDKGMEPASNNDQLIRTVPGTDVGGHDTAGVDGEKRTERKGEILGTPNEKPSEKTTKAREQAVDQADFVTQEVDRANREDLPRLGGDTGPDSWKPIKGGPPEFLSGAHVIGPADKK